MSINIDDIPIVIDEQTPKIESLHRENSLPDRIEDKKDEKLKVEEKLRKVEKRRLRKSNSKDRPGNSFLFSLLFLFVSFKFTK